MKIKMSEEIITHIDWDEWYPVYHLTDERYARIKKVKMPKEKYDWIERVFKEFDKVQDYLESFDPNL